MIDAFLDLFRQPEFVSAVRTFFDYTWLWLPIVLGLGFFEMWIRYVRTKYIMEQGQVLLELKLPKEVTKSPAAMEIIIGALSQPSVGTYLDVYLKGRVRPWFSLELVSLGGYVHFYIWTQKKWKNLIESQIYAQFPTVEVTEVPDYTLNIQYDKDLTSLWGMQLALTKADAYPIKTYVEYGLDKDPKEEFKIDPLATVLEFLGSLKPADQVWIQILIQAHKKEDLKDLRIQPKADWKKDVENEVKEIVKKQNIAAPEEGKNPSLTGLADVQKEVITSIQRNLAKTPFETAIRAIYIAPKDLYNGGNIGSLTSVFKQFGSQYLNGFKPGFTVGFDYPWQDYRGHKTEIQKQKIFDAYRRRAYFHAPYKHFKTKPFILTTEELATLFHFPGGVAATPTLDRTQSRKAEPPSNLPV